MRCESPSTFLGTCLSHHSFIIFLVTNTNTLLSGLYLISTMVQGESTLVYAVCQCPLGLIPHFYVFSLLCTRGDPSIVSIPSRAYTSFLRGYNSYSRRNSTIVSMPSRAYTSFLRYPFKNLGFMRFPEPVFAVICQNILATAVFRAC